VHEGWNYHKWETVKDQPKYRFYRFQSLKKAENACKFTEIKFTGVEVIDNTDANYKCTPAVTLVSTDEKEENQVIELNPVEYQAALTGVINAISPRFGNVVGGEDITFTGKGLDATKEKYKITMDGIDCPLKEATTTKLVCTTGKRPGLRKSTLSIVHSD